jgi:DNA-binding NarL/FixJ family response regulator
MDAQRSRQLTPRQEQYMRLLVSGKTRREISEILGVSHGSVKSMFATIYCKLGVDNGMSAAAAWIWQNRENSDTAI